MRSILTSFLLMLSITTTRGLELSDEFTPSQYHIQTDEGDRRFFKYQTWSGQFRKETRLDDGSVVGSYGWVDAEGIMRMYDYIADNQGYRITKDRAFQIEQHPDEGSNKIEDEGPSPKKLVKKKKKALFELPNNQDIRSLPSERQERRISPDFVPIFDVDDVVGLTKESLLTPETTTTAASAVIKSLPPSNRRRFNIQPRGEGYRLQYRPQSNGNSVPLQRSPADAQSTGRFYVVKRKKRPNSRNEEEEAEPASTSVNYQTDKTFHHEAVLQNGDRVGEYGYIDPIGVRRVVKYSTGPHGAKGIQKAKENDYVGPNTYFEAN